MIMLFSDAAAIFSHFSPFRRESDTHRFVSAAREDGAAMRAFTAGTLTLYLVSRAFGRFTRS
jgi:hypothetical protein